MKSCPFCNSVETRTIPVEDTWTEIKNFRVVCEMCDSMGPAADTPEQAERFWGGALKGNDAMKRHLEEDMGGVSAPGATLTNVPGVGTATPAATAGLNTNGPAGSGDKWGDSSIGMQTNEAFVRGESPQERSIDLRGPDGNAFVILAMAMNLAKQLQEADPERYDPERIKKEMTSGDYKNLVNTFEDYFGDYVTIYNADVLDESKKEKKKKKKGKNKTGTIKDDKGVTVHENNLNPYDKIGAMMAKKMGVKQPFKKKDSRTNTIKQQEIDEDAQESPNFSLPTLDQYAKACQHVPDHPLTSKKKKVNEGEQLRDDNALKDIKAKDALSNLGIAFEFKPGKSGKDRVFITDPMQAVLDKIEQGEWTEYGKNPENTIRKFEKGEKILTIYADGKDLPRATLTNKVEIEESIQIRKVVSNSLDPYLK